MCLAIPMKIIEIKDKKGIVEVGGVKREIGLQLMKNIKVGDYVIVHAGFAIQILDEKEAKETIALFEEMERLT